MMQSGRCVLTLFCQPHRLAPGSSQRPHPIPSSTTAAKYYSTKQTQQELDTKRERERARAQGGYF